jgi:hypothetical protein
MRLNYKVLVELKMLSPLRWNISTLLSTVGTFCVLLDSPLINTILIHKLIVVATMPKLRGIPEKIVVWIQGIA